MRRCVCLLLSAGILFGLSACGAKAPPPPSSFSADVSIVFGEARQEAALELERPGALRLSFTSPDALRGMALSLEGDTATLEYKGLQTILPTASLPGEGAAQLLNQVLLQLAQPPEKKTLRRLRGGGFERKGEANGLHYIACLDEEGALLGLQAPKAGLEIKIRRS